MMREAGYATVEWEYLTLGIVALHVGAGADPFSGPPS
jgi:hypothetical protein